MSDCMARPKLLPLQAFRNNIPVKSKLLLAVSGGQDSVALLHCAVELAASLQLRLEVAHVNHGLRPESTKDAQFVKQLARNFNLPFHLKKASAPKNSGANIEAWGRKIRYDFFKAILKKRKLDFVLTAHTADDVAETLLMRLFSNKELTSIARMETQLKALRPFLEVSREAISNFILERKLSFVEDSTNSDPRYMRNWVRHVVMPILKKDLNQRAGEALSRRAQYIAEDQEFLSQMAQKSLHGLSNLDFGSKTWLFELKKRLVSLPKPIQWRFIELVFKPALNFNLGRLHCERVINFLLSNGAKLELPDKLELRRNRGQIVLLAQRQSSKRAKANHFEYLY